MATMASSFLPLFILSGFGSGVVSLMNYGKNIADIPNSIITAQITSVSAIELNEEAAKNDQLAMQQIFFRTGKLLLYLLMPISFFMFLFSHPIVQLFYVRGNFSITELDTAAEFLKWLSLAIFSTGINALVARVFTAMQAIRQAFIYQISLNALLFVLIWILTGIYGAIGYPYAVVITGTINFVLMYIVCRLLFSELDYMALIKYTGLLLIINGLIAIPLFYATVEIPVAGWIRLGLCFFVYLFLWLVLKNKLLKPADQHS
jgi:putative peptidoglycan lipid II flippase